MYEKNIEHQLAKGDHVLATLVKKSQLAMITITLNLLCITALQVRAA